MSHRYLFVYDTRDRSFPERWILPKASDDIQQIPEGLSGWITDGLYGFDAHKGALRAGYTASCFEIEEMYATSWDAVARNYAGMRR